MRIWMIITLLFTFCFSGLSITPPVFADESTVSVKLVNYIGSVGEIQIMTKGQIQIKESPDIRLSENQIYKVSLHDGVLALSSQDGVLQTFKQPFTLSPSTYSTNNVISLNNRPYIGDVKFTIENQVLCPINTLPIEDYLKGVVPFEMPASWDAEALKAQAIAARTYTMTKKGIVIDDTTRYQVFGGFKWAPSTTKAVEETKGQVLLAPNGDFIQAVYSSSNGGMVESSQNIWGDKSVFSYLTTKPDIFDPKLPWNLSFVRNQIQADGKDLANPDTWWSQTKEADETVSNNLKSWLQINGFSGKEIKIKSISNLTFNPNKTTGNRTVKGSISVEFFVKEAQGYSMENGLLKTYHADFTDFPVDRIRAMLDPAIFKSSLIDSLEVNNQRYTIRGYGFGHGVGMSQYGAKAMAGQGKKFDDILAYYYPGTKLISSPALSNGQKQATAIVEKEPIVVVPSQTRSPEPVVSRSGSSYISGINVKVNGKTVLFPDQHPYIEMDNHRTMVPLRFIAESLGALVDWDNKNQMITLKKEQRTIKLRIGDSTATINGQATPLDTQVVVESNRTFVPLRFITETFNGKVDWDPQTKTVRLLVQN